MLYECKYVIMAAGYHVPRIHEMADQSHELMEGYETCSTNAADYAGENVLVVGAGNAAMEIANAISGRTAHVHLMHRSRLRFAWETHYVGASRGIGIHFHRCCFFFFLSFFIFLSLSLSYTHTLPYSCWLLYLSFR